MKIETFKHSKPTDIDYVNITTAFGYINFAFNPIFDHWKKEWGFARIENDCLLSTPWVEIVVYHEKAS